MVRQAQPGDADAIAEVHVAAWHAAYRGLMPDARIDAFTLEGRRQRWRQNLAQGPARTTVFEQGGRVIAFASVGPSRDEPDSGEIWALYAAPAAWGTGAARALLDQALTYLRQSGFPRTMLWVLEGNLRAIRFYQSAGFHLDGGSKQADGLPHLRMRTA